MTKSESMPNDECEMTEAKMSPFERLKVDLGYNESGLHDAGAKFENTLEFRG